jgi:putative nucleotidyltransferase with HDIG domain
MITEKEALQLLQKTATEKNIKHCKGVAEVAFELAIKIEKNNPSIGINPLKIKIAALLHDIGKSKDGIHELNTIEILKKEGLDDIADIAMHGFLYEVCLLEGKNTDGLLPKNLENKIVVLADMYFNQKEGRVSLEERFEDMESRYTGVFLEAIRLAKPRMKQLEEELNGLI